LDRREDLVGPGVLEEEAAGAEAQRVEHVRVGLEGREHDDAGVLELGRGADAPGRLQAVGGLGDQLQAVLVLDQCAQPAAATRSRMPGRPPPSGAATVARRPTRSRATKRPHHSPGAGSSTYCGSRCMTPARPGCSAPTPYVTGRTRSHAPRRIRTEPRRRTLVASPHEGGSPWRSSRRSWPTAPGTAATAHRS